MSNKKSGLWYVGVDENGKIEGFTSLVDQAMKDEEGVPVLCPGDVRRVWDAEYKRIKSRRDRIWEMLLDKMEEHIELDERITHVMGLEKPDMYNVLRLRKARFGVEQQMEILHATLAVLELPLGKYDTDPDGSVVTIENLARQKYEEES